LPGTSVLAFLPEPRLPEFSTANTDLSIRFLLCFWLFPLELEVSSSSSESTPTTSSSTGSHLPSSARAHLSAKVYSSLTVLGSRTLILERILLLCMFEWNTEITAAGCISGMLWCTQLNLCMYFHRLSPSFCGRTCKSLGLPSS
jgi:hypothetical protein